MDLYSPHLLHSGQAASATRYSSVGICKPELAAKTSPLVQYCKDGKLCHGLGQPGRHAGTSKKRKIICFTLDVQTESVSAKIAAEKALRCSPLRIGDPCGHIEVKLWKLGDQYSKTRLTDCN